MAVYLTAVICVVGFLQQTRKYVVNYEKENKQLGVDRLTEIPMLNVQPDRLSKSPQFSSISPQFMYKMYL